MKSYGLTIDMRLKPYIESMGEVGVILGVGVKSVEIKRNTQCEGDRLEHN